MNLAFRKKIKMNSSNALYEHNLKSLSKIRPQISQELLLVEEDKKTRIVPTREEAPTLVFEVSENEFGLLHSLDDPFEEAKLLASSLNLEKGDLVLVFGAGLFYHLFEIQKGIGEEGRLLLLEANLPLLKKALAMIDVSPLLSLGNLDLFFGAGFAKAALNLSSNLNIEPSLLNRIKILVHNPSLQLLICTNPSFRDDFHRMVNYPFINLPSRYLKKSLPEADIRLREILWMLLIACPAIKELYRFPPPSSSSPYKKISIIIPVLNNWEFTKRCLKSIFEKTDYPDYEVLVIDNGCQDFTPRGLKALCCKYKNLKVITNKENLGFSTANNQGAEIAAGEYLLFLNNDTQVYESDWLKVMSETLSSCPKIGACGQMGVLYLSDMDGQWIQGIHIPNLTIPCAWLSGYCLLIKKDAFKKAGGWRGDLYGLGGKGEDVHLGYALREAGFISVTTSKWVGLSHFVKRTERQEDFLKQKDVASQWRIGRRLLNAALSNETLAG